MRPKGRDIGKAAGIVRAFFEAEESFHADVAAWGAPGECHTLISSGECRRFRTVRRHVKAVTGLPWRVYVSEVKRRTSPRCVARLGADREPDRWGFR